MTQDGGDLTSIDATTSIFVEKLEGSTHVRLIQELLLVYRGCAPFTKVNSTVTIDISVVENF